MPLDQSSPHWTIISIVVSAIIAGCLLLYFSPLSQKSKIDRSEIRLLLAIQILIITAVVLPAFLGGYVLSLVLGGLWARGLWEIIELKFNKNKSSEKVPLFICLIGIPVPVLLMVLPIFWHGGIWLLLSIFASIVIAPQAAFKLIFPVLLLCLAVESLLLLGQQGNGFMLIGFLYFIVEMFDSFAYLIGRFFGSHKIFPQLSPGKTWEGYFGGAFFALAGGIGFNLLVFEWDWWKFTLTWGIVLVAGISGDLIISWYKRKGNRKDFAPLISLHGGILDIYDSLLFGAIALAAVYFI